MKIKDLVSGVECTIFGDAEKEISGLAYDSRKVKAGDLFFCITGFFVDGHTYAATAVEAGALCLVVTRKIELDVTQILVKDDRAAMALISCQFYGHPAIKMNMIGITGTNGKTSTTYMIKAICEGSGQKVGLIGTIKNLIGEREIKTERTTPESMDLQKLLADMLQEGVDTVVMEVSSHSLELKRVYGILFDVGVFTNLTQDHLDFHKTFERYAEAKRILCNTSKRVAINADDTYADFMAQCSCSEILYYGVKNGQVRAQNTDITPRHTTFDLCMGENRIPIKINISGIFTVYNALAAASACYLLGYSLKNVAEGLAKVKCVPGRFEALDTRGENYHVILDYAHTPDSLENTLKTIRHFAKGRVVCIVGCGGNRDSGKRPIMAKIAGQYADSTVLTSDNPRFEDPNDILAQMEPGIIDTGAEYIIIENRRQAIKYALENAREQDIILLAGKGHEDYQEIKGVKYPFDEKNVVQELLDEMGIH